MRYRYFVDFRHVRCFGICQIFLRCWLLPNPTSPSVLVRLVSSEVGHDLQSAQGEIFAPTYFHLIAELRTSPRAKGGMEIWLIGVSLASDVGRTSNFIYVNSQFRTGQVTAVDVFKRFTKPPLSVLNSWVLESKLRGTSNLHEERENYFRIWHLRIRS